MNGNQSQNPSEIADKQLCFNSANFNRLDFNVERFINMTRRRATIDQIHNDLRAYLRHLQNAMIELINDDYADFVNLSSNLAALRESVEKIAVNSQNTWDSFTNSIADLEGTASFIEQNLHLMMTNHNQQILVRNKTSLFLSIQRLAKFISSRPSSISSPWLHKLVRLVVDVELWIKQTLSSGIPEKALAAKEKCYVQLREIIVDTLILDLQSKCSSLVVIILLLSLIDQMDYALSRVVLEVIDRNLEDHSESAQLENFLRNTFDQLLKLRSNLMDKFGEQQQDSAIVVTFIDKCLLQFVNSFLDSRFNSVLVPSDGPLFKKCFTLTVKFIREYPSHKNPEISPLLKSIKEKFSLIVYFKLETQALLNDIKSKTEPAAFNFKSPAESEDQFGCLTDYSNTVLSAVHTVFSEEIFIPSIFDKFWDFTLKCLSNYVDWIDKVISHFADQQEAKRSAQEERPRLEGWLALVVLARDIVLFDAKLFDFCLGNVWGHLREMKVDPTPFGQCLSLFSEQIRAKRSSIDESLITILTESMSKHLAGVSDIPRQYRWTKKPSPTGFSTYLTTTFEVSNAFSAEAIKYSWTEEEINHVQSLAKMIDVFCEKAEKVLDSVEQTGSSLQRFKRKMAQQSDNSSQQQSADSDEAKIRSQLVFDANFMKQRSLEHGLSGVERLEKIELRGSSGAVESMTNSGSTMADNDNR